MKIKTINGQEFDTDKLNDIESQTIEIIQNSKIKDFVEKNKGFCYIVAQVPTMKYAWTNFFLKDKDDLKTLIESLDSFVRSATNQHYGISVVPLKKEDSEGEEEQEN